jgi:hypothetical protein
MNGRIMVICKAIPFESGGAAGIIRNLFSNSSPGEVLLVGREPKTDINLDELNLPYQFATLPLSNKPEGRLQKAIKFIRSCAIVLSLIKKNQVKTIIGVYRDETSFILAYVISRLTGKSLYLYLTDLYAENYQSSSKRIIQRLIFRRADKIFCLNEGMQEVYENLYGQHTIVIPHSVNYSPPASPKLKASTPFRILFSGSIVYDRLDLLQQLAEIIKEDANYHLRLLCPHDDDFLKENGLAASNISKTFTSSHSEMMKELEAADLLYLPLTFKRANSERSFLQLKSCLGTKSFDYMLSGVPILVHSPSEYLTYSYFEKRSAGILLDSDDPIDLKSKLEEICLNYQDTYPIAVAAAESLKENQGPDIYQKLIRELQT